MYTKDIPAFGPLQGCPRSPRYPVHRRPYTATRMADFGADVIWIENPKGMDVMRPSRWCAEARAQEHAFHLPRHPQRRGPQDLLQAH